MAKTVIGLFENAEKGRLVARDLIEAGFTRDTMSMIVPLAGGAGGTPLKDTGMPAPENEPLGRMGTIDLPGTGPVMVAGPLQSMISGDEDQDDDAGQRGLSGGLLSMGVPESDAEAYAGSVGRGRCLICLMSDDDRADQAARIMSRGGALPIEGRPAAIPPQPATGRPAKAGRQTREIREQVVEEQIQVGKREVDKGGVRVFSKITERPVQEQVTLREEQVHVERHPVNRPATQADLNKGQEEVVIREKAEEPVVAKQARVVEEVVVSKDVQQRTETVQDTVRRKDVGVQQIPGRGAGVATGQGGMQGGTADFARFEQDFRGHSQSAFAGRGQGYEQISPAYRYGWQLAQDQRNRGRDWTTVSQEARADWERQNPGTWDKIEPAVRYAFDRSCGR